MLERDRALFGLDPLFSTPLKLFARSVIEALPLPNHKDLYTLNNKRIIRFAELCAVIISVEQTYSMITYTVDDATATIRCCQWKHAGGVIKPIPLGATVCVRGRISDYRDVRQITIQRIDVVDPNRELMHDIYVSRLLETTYAAPFAIPEEIVEQKADIERELKNQMDDDWLEFMISTQQETDAPKDEAYFKQQLLEYLQTRVGDQPFSKTKPRGYKPLVLLAEEIITTNPELRSDPRSISVLFRTAMENLLREGWIVELTDDKDMFTLVQDEELESRIVNIIKDGIASLTGPFRNGGIMLEYIIVKIQEEKRYSKLPRDRICSCIDRMVERSRLYTTRAREYKLH